MTPAKSAFACVILAASLVAACSDADISTAPGDSPPGTPLSQEELATDFATWLCDGLAQCCDAASMDFDRSACIEAHREKRLRNWTREAERSHRRFDGHEAAECASLIANTPPSCGAPNRYYRECVSGVMDGFLELGEACEYKHECRGQRQGLAACIDGVCTERSDVGGDCTSSLVCEDFPRDCVGTSSCDRCRRGTVCRTNEQGNAVCVAFARRTVGEGERCFESDGERAECDYQDGLYCGPDGTCTRRQQPGEECDSLIRCATGSTCIRGICRDVEVDIGEPCTFESDCGADAYCDRVNDVCKEAAVEGDACGRTADLDIACREGLVCPYRLPPDERRCMRPEVYWCAHRVTG